MARVEAGVWGRQEGCLEAKSHELPGGCAGAAGEPCALGGVGVGCQGRALWVHCMEESGTSLW